MLIIGEAGKTALHYKALGFSYGMKGQYLLPICTQTDFSLEKPIELAEAQDVYTWVSHVCISRFLLLINIIPMTIIVTPTIMPGVKCSPNRNTPPKLAITGAT